MKRDQMWLVGSLLLSVVIFAGGYFLGIAPLFAQAAVSDADRVVAEAQVAANQATLATLKEKYAQIDVLESELGAARQSIPSEAEMSRFVGGLDTLAQSTGAQIRGVTTSDALPYVPPAVVAPVAPAATAESAETTDAAAAPVEAAPVASSTPLIPNAELVDSSNMAIIPVKISISGTFAQNMSFVGQLQRGERIFLVTTLTSSEDVDAEAGAGTFSTEIEGYVYVVLTADAVASLPATAVPAAG